MEEFEKSDVRVNENLNANMSKTEREIYIRRLLLETNIIEEQLKNLGDEEPTEGKNYGIFTLREFYEMHPKFFEGIDPEELDNPELKENLVACMGEDSFVLISDGMVAGKYDNGNFELTDDMKKRIKEVPLQEMLLLNSDGRANEEYLSKYQENFNSTMIDERMPKDMADYFEQVVDGRLVISRDEFRNTLDISDEDRSYLDEKEREMEDQELDEDERSDGREHELENKEKDDDKEKEHEIKEAEERFVNNEIDDVELQKIKDSAQDVKDSKDGGKGRDMESKSIEELEEERAKRITSDILRRYRVPVNARESLVQFFMENDDVNEESLKQVMEVSIANDTQNTGYALRFRSNSPNLNDRIVVWQDNRIIDKRMYDEDIERKMDEEYIKAPTEILNKTDHKLVYTDISGKTFVASLRSQPKDLSDKEAINVINEFERIRSEEKSIMNSKRKMPPHEAVNKLTEAKNARLDIIKKYGLVVPEIEEEISADKEISEDIQKKVNSKRDKFIEKREQDKKEAEEKKEKEDKEDKENDDEGWGREPYDWTHGMRH